MPSAQRDSWRGRASASRPRDTVMEWFGRLCASPWRNAVLAVLYGALLVEIAVTTPEAGLVDSLAAGVAVSAAIGVATLWRERFLVPYSLVSAAGVLITGHLLSATLACYTAVRRGRYALAAALALVPLAFALVSPQALIAHAAHPEATLADSAVIVVVPVLLGFLAKAHKQNARLAAERQALEERERLVRCVHNGVGRQVTLMVLQAGAISVRPDVPEPVKEHCRLITDAGKDAVQALREMVDVVHGPRPAASEGPDGPAERRHTLADLAPLIRRYRDGGQQITVDAHTTSGSFEPKAQDLAYRVVAEGLSNAVRHAPGAAVDVGIIQTGTGLLVAVRNGPPARGSARLPGTGNGLKWLQEEVVAMGGTLHSGPEPGGGFLLEARMSPAASKDGASENAASEDAASPDGHSR
ncbi:sensor histidine kinase [Streptomyces gamaensis]|uniref:histidine kinase n=1 Tax=Streptomyces gamaensis TaxID=1763542 RepID=A0ABW0YW47_9ACTN